MKKNNQITGLQKYDASNMRSMILNSPQQLQEGIKTAQAASLPKNPGSVERIIIAGMGGSALPGELLKLLVGQKNPFKIPTDVHIHRDYGLPQLADKKTLVVCISYSGNTEETISAYKEARKRKLNVAAIASGGALEKLAQKEPMWIKLPENNIPPRLALGMQFAALISLLERLALITPQTRTLEKVAETLRPGLLEQKAKTIAKKTFSRIPVIYASRANKALAYIMKISFNENSKMMAFWNYLPECNHNEIVGFADVHKNFTFFFLSDRTDNPAIQKRMSIMAHLAKKNRMPIQTLDVSETGMYNKIFNTIILSEWISYYCALFNQTDPTPVRLVEEFKKEMMRG